MHPRLSTTIGALAWAAALARAAPEGPLLEKRLVCNADNLLRLLRGSDHLADSQGFCPQYICQTSATATSTIYTSTTYPTVYQTIADASHPMYLYNLQPLLSTTTPIKYASRPTPVTIPGNPTPASLECFGLPSGECYADARRGLRGNAGAAADAQAAALGPRTLSPTSAGSSTTTTTTSSCPSLTTPTWIPSTYGASRVSSACSCILSSATAATVTAYAVSTAAAATSVCTTYTSAHPQSTYAAYCDPSLYVNALASPTTPAGVSAAQTTVSVDSRIDCCQACAGIFNCVFWKYLPQTTFAPNAQFAGGFDPWAPGSCVVGYQTGNVDASGGWGPNVCPNGVAGEFLNFSQSPDAIAIDYTGLYHNGWNEGPCGAADNIYESNEECGCNYNAFCYA